MSCSRWTTDKELNDAAEKINLKKEVKCSGLPLGHSSNELLVDVSEGHNLVVGSTGSGKTQSIVLPMLRLSISSGETFVINDPKGELYKKLGNKIKDEGYKTYVIDFDDVRYGNSWNILKFPYTLYKEGNYDEGFNQLERLSNYIFYEDNKNNDPFWINACRNYFVGVCLYLFENANEDEINLISLYSLCNNILDDKSFIDKIKDNINISSAVNVVLKAPVETKGSILSVFNQKIRKVVGRDNLLKLLSIDDLDINNIFNDKTAIFIISGNKSTSSELIPLFIDQFVNSSFINKKDKNRINLILDEFDNILPINNLSIMMGDSRVNNIRFTAIIKSFKHLENIYGKEEMELIKFSFSNIVYLLSNDIYTIEEISNLCGNKSKDEKLISVEELKLLKNFEAIILMLRRNPIRTNLLPDYKTDYGYEDGECKLQLREDCEIKIYK